MYGPMLRQLSLLISCCDGEEEAAAEVDGGATRSVAAIAARQKRVIRQYRVRNSKNLVRPDSGALNHRVRMPAVFQRELRGGDARRNDLEAGQHVGHEVSERGLRRHAGFRPDQRCHGG